MLPLILKSRGSLSSLVLGYQSAVDYAHAGGLEAALFSQDTVLNCGANLGGITVIDKAILRRVRQDGFIYRATVNHRLVAGANDQIKFKVFRLRAGTYDMVGQSEVFAIPAGGTQTYTFTNPIPCLVGDYIGFWTNHAADNLPEVSIKASAGNNIGYVFDEDVTTTNVFAAEVGNFSINLDFFSYRPYICGTGDSIMAGWSNRQSWYDSFSGPVTGDPLYQLQLILAHLRYQNHAKGDTTWDWVRTTGAVSALLAKPRYLIAHAGVNDIEHDVVWADVLSDMDDVLSQCVAAGVTMLLPEILPCTNFNDARAAIVRTFNSNYAAWCAANSVMLISMHDQFGKIRVSTGELDDLADAYNDDGTHLTAAGKLLQAALYKSVL